VTTSLKQLAKEATGIDSIPNASKKLLSETTLSKLPEVIKTIHNSLLALQGAAGGPEGLTPAVPIKKSITPDFIICLEDGKKLKMLKRHLRTAYDMTPEEYRAKWGLPPDYPMVAPNYAEQRSVFAKKIGLGDLRARRRDVDGDRQRSDNCRGSRQVLHAAAGRRRRSRSIFKEMSPAPRGAGLSYSSGG
jgi:predicted transcriptional regulator